MLGLPRSYTVKFAGELGRWNLLSRDEAGKRYSKKHDETEMEKTEKMEKNRASGKTHSRSKKDFPMALLDSLF